MTNETERMYVVYKVDGFPGELRQGPFTRGTDLENERNDICSYEGVTFVRYDPENKECV